MQVCHLLYKKAWLWAIKKWCKPMDFGDMGEIYKLMFCNNAGLKMYMK